MRERLDVRVGVAERFKRLAELAVKTYPPARAELLIDRLAHERMREGIVAVLRVGQKARSYALINRVKQGRALAQHAL
jgi:hypothetical protein